MLFLYYIENKFIKNAKINKMNNNNNKLYIKYKQYFYNSLCFGRLSITFCTKAHIVVIVFEGFFTRMRYKLKLFNVMMI